MRVQSIFLLTILAAVLVVTQGDDYLDLPKDCEDKLKQFAVPSSDKSKSDKKAHCKMIESGINCMQKYLDDKKDKLDGRKVSAAQSRLNMMKKNKAAACSGRLSVLPPTLWMLILPAMSILAYKNVSS